MGGVRARVVFFWPQRIWAWLNGSGAKTDKARVRRRARRRLFSLGLTWEDGLAGVCARVGFCGVENSGAGKISPANNCACSGSVHNLTLPLGRLPLAWRRRRRSRSGGVGPGPWTAAAAAAVATMRKPW